jgi:hypothetical protein
MMDIATAVLSQHKPTENNDYENKQIIGEAVADIKQLGYIEAKKDGKKWILLKAEVTHPVDRNKEDDNIMYGDVITKFYDPENEDKMQQFGNDMFTAGIELNVTSEDGFRDSMMEGVDKKIYVRCWVGRWQDKVTGEDRSAQNIKILSKSKITDELAIPKVPF